MFALFARRGVAALVARPATLSFAARRSLFATPPFGFPPTILAQDTAQKIAPKPAGKKASKGTPVKRGRPQNKQAAKNKSKDKTQRVRIPKDLKPPKRAPGPYLLFYSSFLKLNPHASTLEEYQQLAKRASEVWKAYSVAEKQPFYDENEARKVQAKQELDEYFNKTSASDLRKLNAIRKAQKKNKIHSTKKSNRPSAPFILFSIEFRTTPEGQELIDRTFPEKRHTVRAAVAAGARWNAMTKAEKAPYVERYEKAREQWKAEKAEQAQSAQS